MKLMQVVLMASTFSFLATNGVIPAIPLSNELQVVVNAGNQVPQFDLEAGGNHVAILAAMFDFGVAYDFGRGVAQDDEGAVRWYRMAANQGDAGAQCNLGHMYENGRGVAQGDEEAVRWYRMAANQGHATAQFNLGVMYENGRGVAKDETEAVRWYRMAANQGHAGAQCNLGFMYEFGSGVVKDKARALEFYKIASDQGHAVAQRNLKGFWQSRLWHKKKRWRIGIFFVAIMLFMLQRVYKHRHLFNKAHGILRRRCITALSPVDRRILYLANWVYSFFEKRSARSEREVSVNRGAQSLYSFNRSR